MKSLLTLGILNILFFAQKVQAACFVNGEEVPCGDFPWWIFAVAFVVGIFFFIFWIKMIINAARSKKTGWLVLIVFTNILGAIIYYFAGKDK